MTASQSRCVDRFVDRMTVIRVILPACPGLRKATAQRTALMAASWFSPSSSIAAISRVVAAASRLEKRPCSGLADIGRDNRAARKTELQLGRLRLDPARPAHMQVIVTEFGVMTDRGYPYLTVRSGADRARSQWLYIRKQCSAIGDAILVVWWGIVPIFSLVMPVLIGRGRSGWLGS
jgi:hypothetical protein